MPQTTKTAASNKPREYITAAASRDTAPRIGLIPSDFTGTEEMDGRKIRALAQPAPYTAKLTAQQWDDMLRLAVELGGGRRGGLTTAIGADDWVVVKTAAGTHHDLLTSVLQYLAAHRLGKRITVTGALRPSGNTEYIDLRTAPMLDMPVEGRVFASRNPQGIYRIPRLLRECDKLISIAPITARGNTPALSILNYLDFTPADTAPLGEPGEVALDLFSFHPAAYAILGGNKNLLIAGTSALAVDTIGAAVLGLEPTEVRHLELAVKRGYGSNEAYSIWTRGVELDQAKAVFEKP